MVKIVMTSCSKAAILALRPPETDQVIRKIGRRQWVVYYTSPRSFKITFPYILALQLRGLLLNFDWLVH